jgi:dTDP-4-amino-4,6-dideoxygalactose transaminase
LPEAERAAEEVLALPVYPQLTKQQVEHVGATTRPFMD